MTVVASRPVTPVVRQHVEDSIVLHNVRTTLAGAPHVRLRHLARFDERLAAHLDGIAVAGEAAWPLCQAELERPSNGAVFSATVRAIQDERTEWLSRLLALSAAIPECRRGLLSAFGWLDAEKLRGLITEFLRAEDPLQRLVGIATCAMHRVDPGLASTRRFEDLDPMVRARAWRAAGELGKHELVSTAASAIGDHDRACVFWAAWSAVLLGDRQNALDLLIGVAFEPGSFRSRAFQVAIQAMSVGAARNLLQRMAQDSASIRRLMRGAGLTGDRAYIPWLISFMPDDSLARLAGEAFSLVTGLDLAWLDLERKPPENVASGPNDDPNDPNVAPDEDEGLPWPDPVKIQAWWDANSHRFQPGVRYFMGEPLSRENCVRVLKEGYQRQRILAAHYLCLLDPGTPLFNTSAPAWRQQRLLAAMS